MSKEIEVKENVKQLEIKEISTFEHSQSLSMEFLLV